MAGCHDRAPAAGVHLSAGRVRRFRRAGMAVDRAWTGAASAVARRHCPEQPRHQHFARHRPGAGWTRHRCAWSRRTVRIQCHQLSGGHPCAVVVATRVITAVPLAGRSVVAGHRQWLALCPSQPRLARDPAAGAGVLPARQRLLGVAAAGGTRHAGRRCHYFRVVAGCGWRRCRGGCPCLARCPCEGRCQPSRHRCQRDAVAGAGHRVGGAGRSGGDRCLPAVRRGVDRGAVLAQRVGADSAAGLGARSGAVALSGGVCGFDERRCRAVGAGCRADLDCACHAVGGPGPAARRCRHIPRRVEPRTDATA